MKKFLLLTGGLVAAASAAVAGGLANAVIESEVIEVVPETGSGFGWIIPILIVGILVALASGDDSSSEA
jgi:opacity protein-like surface antigen